MGRYLAIDIGTSKVAALVLDSGTGQIVALNSVAWDPTLGKPGNRRESNADTTIDFALREVVRPVVHAAGDPKLFRAIGVTGQMHGMVLVSREAPYRTLTNFIDWRDQRCAEPVGEFTSWIAWMECLTKHLPHRTGCRLATGFMGPTLFWMKHNHTSPDESSVASFLPDLMVARLCNSLPVTDPTNAGASGVFNVADRRWDRDLLEALDLREDLFPDVQRPGKPASHLDSKIAEMLGLPEDLPVIHAIGDNQASFLGSVKHPESDLLINIGTGGQISAHIDSFLESVALDVRCAADGGYLLVGSELTGGSAYAMLHRFVDEIGRRCFNLAPDEDTLYAVMAMLAASVPSGSGGLKCDPRFKGTRADPKIRGSFTEIDEDTFGLGFFVRALFEGLTANFKESFQEMPPSVHATRRRIVGSGNAVWRNPLLVDILESSFQLPVAGPQRREEAAFGAALFAAVSIGDLSWSDAHELI